MVDGIGPSGGFGCLDGESMGVVHDTEGLYPCEVTGSSLGSEADEAGVDLEVSIGDQAEVLVLLSMEVEDNTVATNETGVVAAGSYAVAFGLSTCRKSRD